MPAAGRAKLLLKVPAIRIALAAGALIGICFVIQSYWETRRLARLVSEALSLAAISTTAPPPQVFDRIRVFVNENGQQAIDAEYYATGTHRLSLLEAFVQTARGERKQNPVHVDCFTRSRIMETILEHLGYRTRRIDIYSTSLELQSHTFLDVFNPETRMWETQDPAYDIYWSDAATGQRVSLAQRAGNVATTVPCDRDKCRWDVKSRENFRASLIAKSYFDILAIADRREGTKFALYTPRAKIAAVFEHGGSKGTFCELNPKKCADGLFAIEGPGPHR